MPYVFLLFGKYLGAALLLRVLASLAIGFVTFVGAQVGIDYIFGQVSSLLSGLPADAVQIAGLIGVPQAISVIVAAYTVALTLMVTMGSMKTLTFQ